MWARVTEKIDRSHRDNRNSANPEGLLTGINQTNSRSVNEWEGSEGKGIPLLHSPSPLWPSGVKFEDVAGIEEAKQVGDSTPCLNHLTKSPSCFNNLSCIYAPRHKIATELLSQYHAHFCFSLKGALPKWVWLQHFLHLEGADRDRGLPAGA